MRQITKGTNAEVKVYQAIAYTEIVRTHEKKAKAAIIKEKVSEYIAQGIDADIAKIMAKTFYECGI